MGLLVLVVNIFVRSTIVFLEINTTDTSLARWVKGSKWQGCLDRSKSRRLPAGYRYPSTYRRGGERRLLCLLLQLLLLLLLPLRCG